MQYLLVRHEVADFEAWHAIFKSHADAQRDAGLHLVHLFRDAANPNMILLLFRISDVEQARAFVRSPNAAESADVSGVVGTPEILFLDE